MSIIETDINVLVFVSSVQLFMSNNRLSLKIFPDIDYAEASCCVEISETEGSLISETEGSLAVFIMLYSHINPFHGILPSADTPTVIRVLLNSHCHLTLAGPCIIIQFKLINQPDAKFHKFIT
jgi:hypothetical protein